MVKLNPYLNFNGNTEEAFTFYKSVFGGEFSMLMRYRGTHEAENMTEAEKDKIMHIALMIGKDHVIMGTDTLESTGRPVTHGTDFSLSLGTDSEQEADHIFNGLSAGGQATMPMQKTFWNAYFGMLTDKFGIQWMVNYDYPAQG